MCVFAIVRKADLLVLVRVAVRWHVTFRILRVGVDEVKVDARLTRPRHHQPNKSKHSCKRIIRKISLRQLFLRIREGVDQRHGDDEAARHPVQEAKGGGVEDISTREESVDECRGDGASEGKEKDDGDCDVSEDVAGLARVCGWGRRRGRKGERGKRSWRRERGGRCRHFLIF